MCMCYFRFSKFISHKSVYCHAALVRCKLHITCLFNLFVLSMHENNTAVIQARIDARTWYIKMSSHLHKVEKLLNLSKCLQTHFNIFHVFIFCRSRVYSLQQQQQ